MTKEKILSFPEMWNPEYYKPLCFLLSDKPKNMKKQDFTTQLSFVAMIVSLSIGIQIFIKKIHEKRSRKSRLSNRWVWRFLRSQNMMMIQLFCWTSCFGVWTRLHAEWNKTFVVFCTLRKLQGRGWPHKEEWNYKALETVLWVHFYSHLVDLDIIRHEVTTENRTK